MERKGARARRTLPRLRNMLLIARNVLERIRSAAVNSPTAEVGGILLGERKPSGIVVTIATLPARLDICERYSFHRRDPSHQRMATLQWVKSGFKTDWVGEWHSHPQDFPIPSSVDRETWKSQTIKRCAMMSYVIVGTRDNWIGQFDIVTLSARRLRLVEETEATVLFCPA